MISKVNRILICNSYISPLRYYLCSLNVTQTEWKLDQEIVYTHIYPDSMIGRYPNKADIPHCMHRLTRMKGICGENSIN